MTTNTQSKVENSLSKREFEIFKLIALGKARAQIAADLKISVFTYDEHRKNIKNKLGLQSYTDWARVLMPFID